MRSYKIRCIGASAVLLSAGVIIGLFVHELVGTSNGAERRSTSQTPAGEAPVGHHFPPETAAAYDPDWERPYPQYQPVGKVLQPCPKLVPGEICPQDLSIFGGAGRSSFASVDEVASFGEFMRMCVQNKPKVMDERQKYMVSRYDFSGAVSGEVTMTRGKSVPLGPVVRLPAGVKSWTDLAAMGTEEIRKKGLFPLGFMPLSHPLHTVGHQLFPQSWTNVHPDHETIRRRVRHPRHLLPEFPPPLFLTTRPDLGDVSRGYEITQANFRELFDGIITPEQMEGSAAARHQISHHLVQPDEASVTEKPVRGTACFDCHVNGHTNGAIAMDPATRPTLAAHPRSIRPPCAGTTTICSSAPGGRSVRPITSPRSRNISTATSASSLRLAAVSSIAPSTNRMGDFNAIIAWPPAPKLDRFGRLIASKATPSELAGRGALPGKARCISVIRPRSIRTTRCTTSGSRSSTRPGGGLDQDILASRNQGLASVFPRRSLANLGRHRRVLQFGLRAET